MKKELIVKAIGAIGKASAKLTKDVQACAVDCVIHAVQHGDVTLADQLVDALGKQGRKASLRAWFEINGCMFIAKGKQTFSFDKLHKLDRYAESELREMLMAKPWEDAKPEAPIVSVLEITAKFDKFLDRLVTEANDATQTGAVVHGRAFLDHMVAEAAKWHAREVLQERSTDAAAVIEKAEAAEASKA